MGHSNAAAAIQWAESTKLAVLGLNGTLYAGTLGIDLLNELARQKLVQPDIFEKALNALESYVQGELRREQLATHVYALCGEAIIGLTQEQVTQAAATAWEQNKHRVFPFVGELLSTLSQRGYTTVLMTGSPTEIVSQFTRTYAFDHVYAAGFQLQGGRYTGRLQFSPGGPGQKRGILQRLVKALDVDLNASLVIGDSENDFEMFDLVGLPIAMNPEGHLKLQFQSQGWKQAAPTTLLSQLPQWIR
jgi:HAD superfamily phosphoserine phosphatase-like hydrolase